MTLQAKMSELDELNKNMRMKT